MVWCCIVWNDTLSHHYVWDHVILFDAKNLLFDARGVTKNSRWWTVHGNNSTTLVQPKSLQNYIKKIELRIAVATAPANILPSRL